MGLFTAILVVFLESACNLPGSGDLARGIHTHPALCPSLSNVRVLLIHPILLVLQKPF